MPVDGPRSELYEQLLPNSAGTSASTPSSFADALLRGRSLFQQCRPAFLRQLFSEEFLTSEASRRTAWRWVFVIWTMCFLLAGSIYHDLSVPWRAVLPSTMLNAMLHLGASLMDTSNLLPDFLLMSTLATWTVSVLTHMPADVYHNCILGISSIPFLVVAYAAMGVHSLVVGLYALGMVIFVLSNPATTPAEATFIPCLLLLIEVLIIAVEHSSRAQFFQVRAQLETTQRLLEQLTDGFFALDVETRTMSQVSPHLCKIFGCRDLEGACLFDFVADDCRPMLAFDVDPRKINLTDMSPIPLTCHCKPLPGRPHTGVFKAQLSVYSFSHGQLKCFVKVLGDVRDGKGQDLKHLPRSSSDRSSPTPSKGRMASNGARESGDLGKRFHTEPPPSLHKYGGRVKYSDVKKLRDTQANSAFLHSLANFARPRGEVNGALEGGSSLANSAFEASSPYQSLHSLNRLTKDAVNRLPESSSQHSPSMVFSSLTHVDPSLTYSQSTASAVGLSTSSSVHSHGNKKGLLGEATFSMSDLPSAPPTGHMDTEVPASASAHAVVESALSSAVAKMVKQGSSAADKHSEKERSDMHRRIKPMSLVGSATTTRTQSQAVQTQTSRSEDADALSSSRIRSNGSKGSPASTPWENQGTLESGGARTESKSTSTQSASLGTLEPGVTQSESKSASSAPKSSASQPGSTNHEPDVLLAKSRVLHPRSPKNNLKFPSSSSVSSSSHSSGPRGSPASTPKENQGSLLCDLWSEVNTGNTVSSARSQQGSTQSESNKVFLPTSESQGSQQERDSEANLAPTPCPGLDLVLDVEAESLHEKTQAEATCQPPPSKFSL